MALDALLLLLTGRPAAFDRLSGPQRESLAHDRRRHHALSSQMLATAPRQSVPGRTHVSDEQLAAMVADQLRVHRVTLVAQRVEECAVDQTFPDLHPTTHQNMAGQVPVRQVGSMRVDWNRPHAATREPTSPICAARLVSRGSWW
jgi:hypothetical protein